MVAISGANSAGTLQLLYSFDREYQLLTLRMEMPIENAQVPSVSTIFFCAVLYENELHDLFGLQVREMVVDFKGNLYQTAVKFPFGGVTVPQQGGTVTLTASSPASASLPAQTSTGTTK